MRLLFDDCRLEMLVGYVAGELVCGEEPLDKASTSQGMLGKLNVGVTNATTHETVAVTDAKRPPFTSPRTWPPIHRRQIDQLLSHASTSLEMWGAGHVFHLDNSYVAFGPLDNGTLTVSFSDGGQLQVYSGDGYCHGVYRGNTKWA